MAKTTDIPLSTFATAINQIDLGGFPITNMAYPASPDDAATKQYVDDNVNVPVSVFQAATAPVDLGGFPIVNLQNPNDPTDAATKQYVDETFNTARSVVIKDTATTLTDEEVMDGLVLITDVVAITLPAAEAGNTGADLLVSASAAASLICTAGFHGGGVDMDTLTFAANQGAHVYSDGANWYLVGCGPDCTLS